MEATRLRYIFFKKICGSYRLDNYYSQLEEGIDVLVFLAPFVR